MGRVVLGMVGDCLLLRLLRTVHARLMLHGVQKIFYQGLQAACCGLRDTCPGGEWDSSCCTGMLRVAWCREFVACLRVARCTLDAAQCKVRSLRGGGCDRIAAVGIGRGACCTLYAACCVLPAACFRPSTRRRTMWVCVACCAKCKARRMYDAPCCISSDAVSSRMLCSL